MADAKRPTGSFKVPIATPSIGGPGVFSTVPLEAALAGCIGARIRVTTINNVTHEGTLFTADPILNLIAINTTPPPPTPAPLSNSKPNSSSHYQPGDYRIIPISKLQSFQLISIAPEGAAASKFENAMPTLKPVDLVAIKRRERAAIDQEIKKARRVGKGVGEDAQELYNMFERTLPTNWQEKSIVVLEAVIISPPYQVEDCLAAPKDAEVLKRVKMMVEAHYRKKVAEKGAGANTVNAARPAIPNIPLGRRKGG